MITLLIYNYDYRCGNREKVKGQTSKLKHQKSKVKGQIFN